MQGSDKNMKEVQNVGRNTSNRRVFLTTSFVFSSLTYIRPIKTKHSEGFFTSNFIIYCSLTHICIVGKLRKLLFSLHALNGSLIIHVCINIMSLVVKSIFNKGLKLFKHSKHFTDLWYDCTIIIKKFLFRIVITCRFVTIPKLQSQNKKWCHFCAILSSHKAHLISMKRGISYIIIYKRVSGLVALTRFQLMGF